MYATNAFPRPRGDDGLFRYRDWLPVRRTLTGAVRPEVYHGAALGRRLGLPNLWIAFNGYWPERGCAMTTSTFKELEAYTALGRLPHDAPTLVVSSAGNTAAAFAALASRYEMPCVIVVPAAATDRLMFQRPLAPCVRLVMLEHGDYTDAIAFGQSLATALDGQVEGGAKNVARRAGLATVLLAAAEAMPVLPDYYVQAVGSGAGAIAVHEAARRLVAAGTADRVPKLLLCQNESFAPLHDAWRRERDGREWPRPTGTAVFADELVNRLPPYGVLGGVRDCLLESDGDMLVADRPAALAARRLFQDVEGIDIEPAAAVALACLCEAAATGMVDRDATLLLNVTGGGRRRLAETTPLRPPDQVFSVSQNDLRDGTFPRELLRARALS
ncbi:cysteate synthase [Actinophytocola oryzae]|uniref:Cysteate synthase n=1 Tax=Actinophytocola oryzae TaxID=502181 RepID=A0A4R7V1A0_9PSEU|nr:cysteate synthase [Actinophytocola oryzae]